MTPRTLAGRIAAIQTVVTLLALTAAVVATTVTISVLLDRRADRGLRDIAARVAVLIERQDAESIGSLWVEREIDEIRPIAMRVEIRDRIGRTLAALGVAAEFGEIDSIEPGCGSHGTVRRCTFPAGAYVIVTATDEQEDLRTRDVFLVVMLIMIGLAAALVTFSSRAVARRTLAPLSRLTSRLSAINPGSGERVAMHSEIVELDRFAARFDDLLARFDDALARERRLTAHASHELRTPLTVARAEIDALASGADSVATRGRALAALDRLSALVEVLLWFARAEVRLDDAAMDVVNLADLVRAEVTERMRLQPEISARCDLPDEALVRGDERLLCRLAANLVDNAVKHGEGGDIELRAERAAGVVRLSIINRGQLADGVADRVFEPFFRGPRAANLPGFGVGLPFARAVARAHGGDLVLGASDPGHTAFVLRLPVVAWSNSPEGP
jgi:signal transduction histidine kinase